MNDRYLALRRHREGQAGLRHMQTGTTQYHRLYMVEDGGIVQDPDTGLPTQVPQDPVLVTDVRVVLGGQEIVNEGGATMRVGDARVSHIRRDYWPLERLLAAVGFRIDDPDGELYQILEGQVVETGHNTYSLVLSRMSQPRPE